MCGVFRLTDLHAAGAGVFQHFTALWRGVRTGFGTFTCLKLDTDRVFLHPVDGEASDQLLGVLVGLVLVGLVLVYLVLVGLLVGRAGLVVRSVGSVGSVCLSGRSGWLFGRVS